MQQTDISFRLLTEADLADWLALEQQAFPDPWTEKQLLSLLARPRNVCFGCFELNQLLGFAVCSTVLDETELLQIAVAESRRGSGLSQRFFAALIQELSGRGVARMLLEVRVSNNAAIGFHRSRGFSKDGCRKDYYPTAEGREDALLMSLSF